MRVTAASRGRPPTGTRQKQFTAAGLPNPRVPLGATNPEQRGAARSSQRSAAARSATQRQRRVPHRASSAVQSTKDLETNYAPAAMVNWQEAGRTWPRPHPHAACLLRGLAWDQHYRHSHPQCEGGMPGSFELREDMGEDRLRAVEEWLRAEGYEYRFRRKRWRTWTRPDRPGGGLRPDGIEEDEDSNEYPSGATINVSMWDMIEKNFPEPGSERRLQGSSSASPGKEKRSAGDRKRDRKWREYQESLAAEAAQGAKGGTPAPSPQRANGGHHPGHATLGDFMEVAKQTRAKSRPLLLRPQQAPAGPSSDVEPAHRGRMPADQASSSSSAAPAQRDVARACERVCGVPCNLRVARQRATQQNAAVEGPSASPMRRPPSGAEAWTTTPRKWQPSRPVSRLRPPMRQWLPGSGQPTRKPAGRRRPLPARRPR